MQSGSTRSFPADTTPSGVGRVALPIPVPHAPLSPSSPIEVSELRGAGPGSCARSAMTTTVDLTARAVLTMTAVATRQRAPRCKPIDAGQSATPAATRQKPKDGTMHSSPQARSIRALLLVLAAAVASFFFASPASADDSTYLRLAHLSPDTPAVDVYVSSVADPNSAAVFKGVGYGVVSEYQKVPAGTYTISMRPAGAPATSPAVISTTVKAAAGEAHTIAGVGNFASLGLKVLSDDLSLPNGNEAKARVIQASASKPKLDISVQNGDWLGQNVEFASTTPYTMVPAGEQTLLVAESGKTVSELAFGIKAGSVYTVLVLDSPSGLKVAVKTDSVATAVVPTGGVETGAGGMASSWLSVSAAALAGIFAIALVVGLNAPKRRSLVAIA